VVDEIGLHGALRVIRDDLVSAQRDERDDLRVAFDIFAVRLSHALHAGLRSFVGSAEGVRLATEVAPNPLLVAERDRLAAEVAEQEPDPVVAALRKQLEELNEEARALEQSLAELRSDTESGRPEGGSPASVNPIG
jgi:hypothetical protein